MRRVDWQQAALVEYTKFSLASVEISSHAFKLPNDSGCFSEIAHIASHLTGKEDT